MNLEPEIAVFIYVIIILSAIFHEYSHAWMATYLGDPTPKNQGRLTLNPIAHMDPFGTVILPVFLMLVGGIFIGYAKPVPFNPHNLEDPEYGPAKVAIAGPASNFLIAFIFAMVLRFASLTGIVQFAISYLVFINIILGLFNLIPVPPLDGSKLLNTFTSFNYSIGQSFVGRLAALFIAFMILPRIAQVIFALLTGMSF